MNFEKISLLVIAGDDKKFLEVGDVKILESILQKAVKENFAEIFLCAERETVPLQILSWKYDAKILIDKSKNSSPISEILRGLSKIKSRWAFVVSADMPFFDFEIFKSVDNFSRYKVILPAVNKKIFSLAGFYHKSLTKFFSTASDINQLNILDAAKKIPHKILKLSDDQKIFFKINNRADLRMAQGRALNLARKIPTISIILPYSGEKFFTEKLLKKLAEENISVGLIKSEVPNFNLDLEKKSAAKALAVVSADGWLLFQKTKAQENFSAISEKMTGVDLILIESRTQYTQPTFSIWDGESDIVRDKNVAAIFSAEPQASDDILHFDWNDIDSAVKLCKFLMN